MDSCYSLLVTKHLFMSKIETYKPEISVDCVVFGFDGSRLKVLLVQRNDEVPVEELEGFNNRKLPGSIILPNEDLDSAAYRILEEYTGLSNIYLDQFRLNVILLLLCIELFYY